MTTRTVAMFLCSLSLAILAAPGCSDDPGSMLAPACAVPTGQRLSITHDQADIGPDGGSVATSGAMVVIPVGALSETVTITITKLPDGTVELEPHGQTFAVPVDLHLSVPKGKSAEECVVQWLDLTQGTWATIASGVGGMGRVAPLEHFSKYRAIDME